MALGTLAVLVVVSFSCDRFAPVYNRLTGLTVGSVIVAVNNTSSVTVTYRKLCVMIMPRINSVIDHGFDGDTASEEINIVDDTLNYATIDRNYRAISRCKLGCGSNGFACHMVNTIPSPETNRDTYNSRFVLVNCFAISLNGKRKNAFSLIKSVRHFEAIGNRYTCRLPCVCILKQKIHRHIVNGSNIRNIYIYIIYRTIFRL